MNKVTVVFDCWNLNWSNSWFGVVLKGSAAGAVETEKQADVVLITAGCGRDKDNGSMQQLL